MMAENPDLEAFKQRILGKDYFVMDQWQLEELAKVVARCKVKVVSDGLPPETLRRCYVEPAATRRAGGGRLPGRVRPGGARGGHPQGAVRAAVRGCLTTRPSGLAVRPGVPGVACTIRALCTASRILPPGEITRYLLLAAVNPISPLVRYLQ